MLFSSPSHLLPTVPCQVDIIIPISQMSELKAQRIEAQGHNLISKWEFRTKPGSFSWTTPCGLQTALRWSRAQQFISGNTPHIFQNQERCIAKVSGKPEFWGLIHMERGGHSVYRVYRYRVVLVALQLTCSVSLWNLCCEQQEEEDSAGGSGRTTGRKRK